MQNRIPLWKEAPFVRLVLPFITGIVVQYYCANPLWFSIVLFVWNILGLIAYENISVGDRYTNYHLAGICVILISFSFGCIVCTVKNPFTGRGVVSEFISGRSVVTVVRISETLLEKKSSWKTSAEILEIRNGDTILLPETKILLYFKKKSHQPSALPGYGNRIAVNAALKPIENFPGAGSFDYVRYCALKNIHYQVFLDAGDYVVLDSSGGNRIYRLLNSTQQWIISHLKRTIPDAKSCGLALALLIGYKNDLDQEVIKAYSNTGVVHVVAISGLHLGIIYSILSILAKPVKKYRGGKWLETVFVLSGLWMFSLLAGASPSVLRSAVMFSFIVAGNTVSRNTSLINNLSASAFFLLCYDPFWIFDLGFQLSYGALLSIAAYAKPLYNAVSFDLKVADSLWKLNSVTLAAQILTFPVILFQFQQFPYLFLVTNMIAIPASTIILIAEIILCLISFLPQLALQLGGLISHMIHYLNKLILSIDHLPFASATGVQISFTQTILLYLFISLISTWLLLGIKKSLHAALLVAIAFFTLSHKIWQ